MVVFSLNISLLLVVLFSSDVLCGVLWRFVLFLIIGICLFIIVVFVCFCILDCCLFGLVFVLLFFVKGLFFIFFVLVLVVIIFNCWFFGIVCSLLVIDFNESFLIFDCLVLFDCGISFLVINSSFFVGILFLRLWFFVEFLLFLGLCKVLRIFFGIGSVNLILLEYS